MSTYSVLAFTLLNIISTSVAVNFLSNNFKSLFNFANLELSMSGVESFPAPKAQNDLKTSSIVASETKRETSDNIIILRILS